MIERSASFPTRFMSSPWPAMPMTSVLKISGTISDLIIRRKMFDRTRRSVPAKTNDWSPAAAAAVFALSGNR